MMQIDWSYAGEVAGCIASGLAVLYGIIRFFCWCRKVRQMKLSMQKEILDGIRALASGQTDIWVRLEKMDKLRQQAREEDSEIRGNQYLGTIAIIAAIREVAKGVNIEINGEVQQYYEQNINALRKGLGMTPLEINRP